MSLPTQTVAAAPTPVDAPNGASTAKGAGMVADLADLWAALPHKGPVLAVLAAWTALFHFLGNATLGYVGSRSMFAWAYAIYQNGQKTDTDDQLGLIAPIFVAVIVAIRARDLKQVAFRPWRPAALLVAVGLLMHLGGFVIQQTRVSLAGFLLGAYGVMGVFWGLSWLRAFLFPYCLLVFCIPVSIYMNNVTEGLQIFSAHASTSVARTLFNLNITWDGGTGIYHAATKTHPAFPITVAPACSGMRSAMVSLLVVTCYAFLSFRSRRSRLLLITLAPVIALGANILRLLIANVAGDIGGPPAVIQVESNAGLFTYPVALAAVALLGRFLPDARWARRTPQPPAAAPAAPATTASSFPAWGWAAALLAATGLNAAALDRVHSASTILPPGVTVVPGELKNETGTIVRTNLVSLPDHVQGFLSDPASVTDAELNMLPADTTYGRRMYKRADDSFGAIASVVLMGGDRTSIHRPEYCLIGSGWDIDKVGYCTIPLAGGRTLTASRLDLHRVVAADGARWSGIYVYWYVTRGLRASDIVRCQWSMIRSLLLRGETQRWAYVSFLTPCPPGAEDLAFDRLSRLIAAAQPDIEIGPLEDVPAPFFKSGILGR